MVKLIHILKRVEQIDRDINELHQLANTLSNKRSYSHSLLISIELQINNLLNERVKLMELQILNPPEYLMQENKEESFVEHYKTLNQNEKFNFDDHEATYLPILMKSSENQPQHVNEKLEEKQQIQTSIHEPSVSMKYNIEIPDNEKKPEKKHLGKEEPNATNDKFYFNKFLTPSFKGLENLPKIDY